MNSFKEDLDIGEKTGSAKKRKAEDLEGAILRTQGTNGGGRPGPSGNLAERGNPGMAQGRGSERGYFHRGNY